jgi:hypothetical protein
LRAVSKSLAAIFSSSCIVSPLHFAVRNTTGFWEALSVRFRTQRPRQCSAEPYVFRNLPYLGRPAIRTRTSDLPRVIRRLSRRQSNCRHSADRGDLAGKGLLREVPGALPERGVTVHSGDMGYTIGPFAGSARCSGRCVNPWTSV